MGRSTQIVEHGPPALAALRATIDELQGGRPLASVTVVVPSNSVGVGTRRWLAASGGIAAVRFVTIFRLAELLGGPALVAGGRRPVSTPVVDVAVRRALAEAPGMFGPVAHHHATVTALRAAHRELRHVPVDRLRHLQRHGSARAAEVVRIHLAVTRSLATDWYDEADLLDAAVAHLPAAAPPIVVHLPNRLRPAEERLLDALATRTDVRIIEGAAPDRLDGHIDLVDVSDADEEVREVVRRIVAAADQGVAFERIAVVWPVSDPYARLVAEHLDAAGIPWNGRPGVTLHERLAGRLVLDVLAVDRRGLRRTDLFAMLAHVPARTSDGRRVPAARWERTSRAAGLAGGGDWDVRLAEYERSQRARGHDAEADHAAALGGFVADLRARLGSPTAPARWSHWAAVAADLLDRWLGGHRRIAELPAAEHEAYVQVEAALQRLGHLDELDERVTRPAFVDALAAELDAAPARVGRIGDGVQCGPLSFATGQSLEQVYVLGAVEGQLPALAQPDPLLADADRALAAAAGALALSDDAAADQRAALIAAISAARQRILLRPRGDLRTTADRQPSRWIAELATMAPVVEHTVASFAAGLADAAFPALAHHHRVRALVHHARAGAPIDTHPLMSHGDARRRGLALLRSRESSELTAYDGDLAGLPIPSPLDRTVSPTELEAWVACPYAYFVRYLLGVRPVESLDAALRIRPLDLGSLVHDALDAFHQRVVRGDLPQPGPTGWTDVHLDALLDELTASGAQLEAAGRVGRPAAWAAAQSRLRDQLRRWLADDGARVAASGAQVIASEIPFGRPDGLAEASVELGDGRTVRLAGAIDRIDRCADGTIVVLDHKTGSDRDFKGITSVDPTAGGRKLQLAAYAAAARPLAPGATVHAEYSFLRGFRPIGASFPPGEWSAVGEQLTTIIDGIANGLFFAIPPRSQHRLPFVRCEYCDPDHLGTAERYEEFRRKLIEPQLARWSDGGDDD